VDAAGTPSTELEKSFEAVDGALGRMLAALDEEKLTRQTLVIIGAKHGQSPIDVQKLHMLTKSKNPRLPAGHNDVTDPIDMLTGGGVPVAQE
ncbi:alkaline phosphatase family protein, partial [Acinetobacter baumannii]